MKEIQTINRECVRNRILITRIIFFRGLALIYLISFLSLYGQIQALWGAEGLTPASIFLTRLKSQLKGRNYYFFYPTLGWLFSLSPQIKYFTIENLLYILCLLGIIISLSILFESKYFSTSFGFFVLWYIYYNFTILGQIFMKCPWDGLLAEVGFVSIFFLPVDFKYINYITQINNIAFYLMKFILLKFMVSTGINIIGSQCPYWTTFTGLNFFFQGQISLTGFSLVFHSVINDTWKKILSAFGYFCMLYLPIGYFLVWRRFSIYSGTITFLFNLFFIFCGNYSFLNLLVIVVNVLNFDDYFFRSVFSKKSLKKWKLDYLIPVVNDYINDKRKLNEEINKKEEKLNEVKEMLDKENEKKDKKEKFDEEKIKNLEKEYNIIRQNILELVDDEFIDSPKIETSLKADSNLFKEIFIFINFFCANLLLVFLFIYPIKRLIKGMTMLESLPKKKFKTSVIFVSGYVFIYIFISVLINLTNKMKNSVLSEKNIMSSVMTELIEKRNKEKTEDIEKEKEQNEKASNTNKTNNKRKIPILKIIFYSFTWMFKVSKYLIFLIIVLIYFIGSVKYFLLNLNVDLFEEKVRSNKLTQNIEETNFSTFKAITALSDVFFANYFVYGIYGNTQEEILSVNGRTEMEIEYTTKNNPSHWETLNFNFKLGPNNTLPKFFFFYAPRLEWKISEAAATEDLNEDSWIVLLLGKLFDRNQVVMDLLGYENDEKNEFLDKNSFVEKIKESYLGRKKFEKIEGEVEKIKVDLFKYQFVGDKKKNIAWKRKRYKEYLSQIEKYALYLVYEKLGMEKPDGNKKAAINKFQLIPVYDIVIIAILIKGIFTVKNKEKK